MSIASNEPIPTRSHSHELTPAYRTTLGGILGSLAAMAATRLKPSFTRHTMDRRAPSWESTKTAHLRGDGDGSWTVPRNGPTGRDRVLQIPECWALANNDGSVTYAVHNTSIAYAQTIATDGLRVKPRRRPGPVQLHTYPELGSTCLPLDGPGWDQLAANVDKLAVRFYGTLGADQAKVILGFPVPNGIRRGAYKTEAFSGTGLDQEGEYVAWNAELQQYVVPAQYVMGYLVHETGAFVHNPAYWGNAKGAQELSAA